MTIRTVTPGELDHELLPYPEAIARALQRFVPLPPRAVPLRDALGLVSAERVAAPADVPGFSNAAMDGYAVVSSDTWRTGRPVLRVVAGTRPGHPASGTLRPGLAAKVMTGAPIPPGADAVVPWEDARSRNGDVAVPANVPSGRNVRAAGEDVRAGDEILAVGQRLEAVHIGVLASAGVAEVRVHPRPRVAVLSTGDELVPPGRPLGPGQVHDSNSAWIAALCETLGAIVPHRGLVGDDPDDIAAWFADAANAADLIVATGGVSVGEHDWVRDVLRTRGRLEMWRVAMKPGKPTAFGRISGCPVFGLPGNPGAAFAAFHVFVARALRVLSGRDPEPASTQASLTHGVAGSSTRTCLCRVRVHGAWALPLAKQSSAVLSNLVAADGFAIVPPGGLAGGSAVRIEFLAEKERRDALREGMWTSP